MQDALLSKRQHESRLLANRIGGGAAEWEPYLRAHPLWGRAAKALLISVGAVSLAYAGYVAATWYSYGREDTLPGTTSSARVDRFMPVYEVREVHQIDVAASPDVTFAVAQRVDLQQAPLVRAIFSLRNLPARLRGEQPVTFSIGLLAETRAMGWGTLSEAPGREVIMGAVTRPWESAPRFQALLPDRFASFSEPGYAKIIWTLTAEPRGDDQSVFITETRVQTTDSDSRERFRRYWATLSPGILLIRLQALDLVKREAEALAQAQAGAGAPEARLQGRGRDD
jgi:hypothetical protein